MKMLSKTILVLVAAALLLPFIGTAFAQVPANLSDQVEKRPAEQAMENLYNKGMGTAWSGGEPFPGGSAVSGPAARTVSPRPDYRIIGFINVSSGLIIAGDAGSSLLFTPGPGGYPVYAYFENGRMTGVYVDFNSTRLGI
ncbi:MAG TPA: hypothetical protein PKK11_06800 [Methanothrix sp.]|nr:hypothetical protein [Methanothrix sp.]HPT19175.1 hypothetical protein [Methanothrix sp.]